MPYQINLNMSGESAHGMYVQECLDRKLVYRWNSSYQSKNSIEHITKIITDLFTNPIIVRHDYKLEQSSMDPEDEVLLREIFGLEVEGEPAVGQSSTFNSLSFLGYNSNSTVLVEFSVSSRMSEMCSVECELAGTDTNVVYHMFQLVKESIQPFDTVDNPCEVKVKFWSQGEHGTNLFERPIRVPTFEDIKNNYPAKSWDKLQNLIDFVPGQQYGKLILLHGKPGVGKTYFIRSLMQKWKKQFSFNYLVDPEKFFSNAGYMISLLSRIETGADKWNLLISEDVDEFISIDAKQRSGQSLSRLLNLTEGLLGQGINLLLLMTTNEDIEKLHPAVQRQGRCLANLEFHYFSHDEAMRWLESHKKTAKIAEKEVPLSDMYALLTGERITSLAPKKHLGLIDG